MGYAGRVVEFLKGGGGLLRIKQKNLIKFQVSGLALAMVLSGAVTFAQTWQVNRSVDDFTDEEKTAVVGFGDGNLMLWVGCIPEREVRLAIMGDDDLFENGTVDVRFDDGTIEQYEFIDLNEELVTSNADDERLVDLILRSEGEVRFRVRRWENQTVTGRFVLDGLTETMVEAGCVQ